MKALRPFEEADDLFKIMRTLVAGGKSIIFITHKLKEVLAVADRMRTTSGLFWPVPIVNMVKDAGPIQGKKRIALRDRPYERNMELDYIDRLNHAYDDFFTRPFDGATVLTVDTNSLNFVQNPDHLRLIANMIREKLNWGPFQPSLPLDGMAASPTTTQKRE